MVSQNGHHQSFEASLGRLAELYGVPTGYRDSEGQWRESPRESICAVLDALGAELGWESGRSAAEPLLESAVRSREEQLSSRLVEPVIVAWDGVLPGESIRLDVARASGMDVLLALEDGEERHELMRDPVGNRPAALLGRLPFGYHRLHVRAGRSTADATVISAPRRCWAPAASHLREWGVFAPLYALRSDRDWGAGDLADLEELEESVREAGGSTVAVLPLLAAYLDRPYEPSPYRPVSRLFWNEFYLAVERIADWQQSTEARELWISAGIQAEVARLRALPLVDYRAVMALKRRVLEKLCHQFFSGADTARRERFAEYVRTHPKAEAYADLRAQIEIEAAAQDAAAGEASAVKFAKAEAVQREDFRRYHLYCQWQMEEQLARLSGGSTPGLFLDLPVGVHPDGFDTRHWPGLFADGMSFGAPPDSFFALGQDWQSPPLHPGGTRDQGHQYFAACLRHQMRHARYLRIDHVLGLHRLFWVPKGSEAAEGVYVDYPAEELYAVLCLESHRNRTIVVGEDLGTVPPGIRSTMRRHGVLGTWVLQFCLRPRAAQPLPDVPRSVVAGLGTHDMFPFAGFLKGDDIAARLHTGQVGMDRARRQSAARHRLVRRLATSLETRSAARSPTDDGALGSAVVTRLLRGVLARIAASPAVLVMVSVDDLLLETKPQNQPGTGADRTNWCRKIAEPMGAVRTAVGGVADLLAREGTRTV